MQIKLPQEIDNIHHLVNIINEKNPEIILIDGNNGIGKTKLADFLAKELKFDHLKLDDFIYKRNVGYYNINIKKLKIKIDTIKNKKFILEGVMILKYIKKINILKKKEFFLIYVEKIFLKEYKEWEEEWGRFYKKTLKEIIYEEEKNITYINQAVNSNKKIYKLKGLSKQLINYQYYFKLWRKANVIFLNSNENY